MGDQFRRHMEQLPDNFGPPLRPAPRPAYSAPFKSAFGSVLLGSLFFLLPGVQAAETGGLKNPPAAAKLQNQTLVAFDRYVRLTNERNEEELKGGADPLWVDALPADKRAGIYDALKRGEAQIEQLKTLDGGQAIRCPAGMIHHWAAAAFIPGAKLDDVLAILEDYDHQSTYYAPDVERSKVESRDGDHFRVFLRFRRHKVITVVLDTEHDINYFHDGPGRAHSRSSAVRISEVENAGKSDEHEKPPGDDGGFLWRMETWWRMKEGDGGVYVQSEVVSLTRDIPTGLGWMIGPFVTSIPKETLLFTMEATRKAVEARLAEQQRTRTSTGF